MKKLLSILLSAFLLISVATSFSFKVYAILNFDFESSGNIGDYEERPEYSYNDPNDGKNVTYTFDSLTGTLVISHNSDVSESGKMASYYDPIFSGKTEIKHVIINEGVTGLCNGCFNSCTGIEDVSLPSTLTEIAEGAFRNCTSLKSVELKGSVKKINWYAFYNCTSLKSVTLNDGLEDIGSWSFQYCNSLESITIPQSVTEIHQNSFSSTGIKSLTVNDSECIIYPYSFNNCQQLVSADLGTKAVVKSDAFSYCTALKSVVIPGATETVLDDTFYCCTSLESVSFLSGVKRIEYDAFNDCEAIKTVTIPKTLITIDNYTFRECTAITDVYYEGTEAEWKNISIGEQNEPLTSANIHFNAVASITPSQQAEPTQEASQSATEAPTTEQAAGSSIAAAQQFKLSLKKAAVKKGAKKLVLQATLKLNGKAVKGKKITFKFNGKKYTAKTDKKGIAKVTIKKAVLKKLKKGKKITYSATYSNKTVKYTVKVK